MAFERISRDPEVMAGVPCIRGTRIPVATVVAMVADDMTIEEIVADFSQLADDDIRDALRYAAARVDESDDTIEDHLDAAEVRERLAAAGDERLGFEQVAATLDRDPHRDR